jgi:hypothetical protein
MAITSSCVIEDQAFSPVVFFPLQARRATHRKTEKERQLADGRVGENGWWRRQIKSYDGEKA